MIFAGGKLSLILEDFLDDKAQELMDAKSKGRDALIEALTQKFIRTEQSDAVTIPLMREKLPSMLSRGRWCIQFDKESIRPILYVKGGQARLFRSGLPTGPVKEFNPNMRRWMDTSILVRS